jgi:hypothetical protein
MCAVFPPALFKHLTGQFLAKTSPIFDSYATIPANLFKKNLL